MYSRKGKIPKKLLHTVIIVCVAVICLTSIGITAAKYVSESRADATASVALFSPYLTSDNNIDISGIKKPGDSVEKTFQVHNSSGGNVSEVTMKYKIILKTTGNLPLTFTLLDVDGNILTTKDCNGISGKQEYTYENASLIFNVGTSQHHDYKLKVEWQDDRKDARFSGKTDAVYLSVIWEQVD